MTPSAPTSIDQAIEIVNSNNRVLPIGNRTKESLIAAPNDCCLLSTNSLSGITEYEPTEFTFTAKAGTSISEIQTALAANGQWMPSDPAFACSEANQLDDSSALARNNPQSTSSTLAGSVASGINGSCSLRFGGARDFVLGIKFIDGLGNHVTAGGKVVKNAAGFDLPKFFVGSCGRFGILTELTMKVFPKSESYATLAFEGSLSDHLNSIKKINATPLEIEAMDIFEQHLFVRIGGGLRTLETARKRIEELVGKAAISILTNGNEIEADTRSDEPDELKFWQESNSFSWANAGTVLIKIPTQIHQVASVIELADQLNARHRVSLGGQVIYVAIENDNLPPFRKKLSANNLNLQAIRGDSGGNIQPFAWTPFAKKVKNALDPNQRFGTME